MKPTKDEKSLMKSLGQWTFGYKPVAQSSSYCRLMELVDKGFATIDEDGCFRLAELKKKAKK